MVRPAQFIHGFRRENLAIEVVEVPVPERPAAICEPACGSRRGGRRSSTRPRASRPRAGRGAVARHRDSRPRPITQGLDAETRERVQTAFQAGELEVVVATIAFGMGIDKADIRTVIHAGLPGNARGLLSGDRPRRPRRRPEPHLPDALLRRSAHARLLPESRLSASGQPEQVFKALGEEPQTIDELRARSQMEEEEFDKALEKLEIHGGARIDFGGNVTAGGTGLEKDLHGPGAAPRRAIRPGAPVHDGSAMPDGRAGAAFWRRGRCRAQLRQVRRVRSGWSGTETLPARDGAEKSMAAGILDELRPVNYKAAGTLQRGLESLTRGEFDGLLDAMIRAGLVEIENAEYEKDGQVLRFRKVRSTEAGLEFHAAERASLLVADGLADEFRAGSTGKARAKKKTSAVSKPAKTADASIPAPLGPRDQELAARLREWRSAEAKRSGFQPSW